MARKTWGIAARGKPAVGDSQNPGYARFEIVSVVAFSAETKSLSRIPESYAQNHLIA